MIPPVAASDRGLAQTAGVAMHRRGSRTTLRYLHGEEKVLESSITEGDSPVSEAHARPCGILSSAGHEKSCVNQPGPSGKAKYSRETDSVRVP